MPKIADKPVTSPPACVVLSLSPFSEGAISQNAAAAAALFFVSQSKLNVAPVTAGRVLCCLTNSPLLCPLDLEIVHSVDAITRLDSTRQRDL
ncbi:hypothetical protein TARUN_4114 [Trichoderma arundinaceum]|uniref:Uncharacterized protein n=1 Tax=Trichoderma arundinaceum TaxID=490622 RepID=A0A395NQB2_TRIAR|nr:hypothetical protein TARUN_4114 [Trichoderma arundinaceum]